MAIQIRTEQQRNSDLVRISKLYLQGHTQLEIAQQIGVSRTQISYDIKQLFLEWKRERIDVFEERLLIELSKLDHLESEAWKAWENSKKDSVKISEKTNNLTSKISEKANEKTNNLGNETTETIESQNPSKGYLEMVFKCIEMRLKILSVLPKKTINNPEIPENDDLELLNEATISLDNNDR